jgi:hypothetical protein
MDDPPIGKSAIQQVWKPAVPPRKMRYQAQSEIRAPAWPRIGAGSIIPWRVQISFQFLNQLCFHQAVTTSACHFF